MDIDNDDDYDGENHEFIEVIDSIVEYGRFNETLMLLRMTGESQYEIAVPPDVRPYWTVNPFAWWSEEHANPIAYRIDGFHIWPSRSLARPFYVSIGEVILENLAGVIHFTTLEDAMILVDELCPTGRRVRNPYCVDHGPRYGRTIRFGQPARSRSAKSKKA